MGGNKYTNEQIDKYSLSQIFICLFMRLFIMKTFLFIFIED